MAFGDKGNVKKTTKSRTSKTKIDKNVDVGRIMAEEERTEFYCSCCGKKYTKQKGNFPYSNSPLFAGNGGYVTICKSCIDKYFYNLVDFFSGNEEKAADRMCQICDWFYADDIWGVCRKISSDRSRIGALPSKASLPQYKQRGTTYLDTIKERASANINDAEDLMDNQEGLADLKVRKRTISMFGMGYSMEQYKFLQEQYDDWVSRCECKSKAQEELFKNLCIAQLNIQIAQQTGGKVKDAMDTFQSLLGSANLKPVQNNDNALADSQSFGTLIKKFEEEKPIPEPDPEWKDVDGIVRYITVYFLGHLCKMIGIKNNYARMYDEEMAKYKVEKPQYDGGDDEALFDAVIGGAKNGSEENR
jgi:hypothetical protein